MHLYISNALYLVLDKVIVNKLLLDFQQKCSDLLCKWGISRMAHSTTSNSHDWSNYRHVQTAGGLSCFYSSPFYRLLPFWAAVPSLFLLIVGNLSDFCSNVAIGQFRLIFFPFVYVHFNWSYFPSLALTSHGIILQAVMIFPFRLWFAKSSKNSSFCICLYNRLGRLNSEFLGVRFPRTQIWIWFLLLMNEDDNKYILFYNWDSKGMAKVPKIASVLFSSEWKTTIKTFFFTSHLETLPKCHVYVRGQRW